jgi:ATP-dependent DNA ligase
VTEMPFQLIKPIKGGKPLGDLYRRLEADEAWICQAKLNGKRALWDGQFFWSRQGNRLDGKLADQLRQLFPDIVLDGELVGDVYWVFDCAEVGLTLDDRLAIVRSVVGPQENESLRICPIVSRWEEVNENKWEGVVFKRRSSKYLRAATQGKETTDWVKFRAEWL